MASKFSSVSNANRRHKSKESACIKDGTVYVCIFDGTSSLLGKLKKYVEDQKADYTTYGENYNGYGYQDHYHVYYLTAKDGKTFLDMLNGKKKNVKKKKTWKDIRDAWARSLVKKSGNAVSFEEAQTIAEEKIQYKDEKITEMETRQYEGYSIKRQRLIAKMERANPLRPIKDNDHALAIIAASYRHNQTSYDQLLWEAHQMERNGEMEPGTAKAWAREQIKKP